jgi:hypothetical protein
MSSHYLNGFCSSADLNIALRRRYKFSSFGLQSLLQKLCSCQHIRSTRERLHCWLEETLIDKPNKETLAWPYYVLFMLNELNVLHVSSNVGYYLINLKLTDIVESWTL